MGRHEHGWLVCAAFFLGFVAAAQCVTRGELFPFGPSAGDKSLDPGNDQTHRLDLEKPLLFYDGTFDSIFVSQATKWFTFLCWAGWIHRVRVA